MLLCIFQRSGDAVAGDSASKLPNATNDPSVPLSPAADLGSLVCFGTEHN
jgi:hypothetical protein